MDMTMAAVEAHKSFYMTYNHEPTEFRMSIASMRALAQEHGLDPEEVTEEGNLFLGKPVTIDNHLQPGEIRVALVYTYYPNPLGGDA
jgi:hypothetical protein